ncbi:abl interactor 2 isoform X1 [Octopus vulgaris]|uniref:Abl interactor 2 n=2 Tax=Octopus TaxID=6643 RepID=A0AA36FAW7_OCTVU|nr:abl interactor 1 isoform X2 [Octopus sinensis]UUA79775.1 abl interactor 2 [Octopus vulgaris]CAI9728213.1 abl interactor 2 isoform X1 [Octopus vulgaris]
MATAELVQLIEEEIPEGKQHLQESYTNLNRVAEYCEGNYHQSDDKVKALEETKNYTTHSLASVAYQINNLAASFLKLMDLQQGQLVEMESNVNHLAQMVMIHKEKVARREIGVLTANRNATRPPGVKNGIIFPEQVERPMKYIAKPIDYGTLDDIGHGMKVQTLNPRSGRSASMSSGTSTQAPTSKPPTPPTVRACGTLGRSQGASHYRTPAPPVAPPSVPSHYAPNYAMQGGGGGGGRGSGGGRGGRDGSGYAATSAVMSGGQGQTAPPVGMTRPMPTPQTASGGHTPSSPNMAQGIHIPPQMLPQGAIVSPPLPPPPNLGQQSQISSSPAVPQQFDYPQGGVPPPPPEFSDALDDDQPLPMPEEDPYAATGPDLTEPQWMPKKFLEKVVAIYDYQADKADELTFTENAVIYVIKKNDDGWWEGVMDGVTGLFPGNYVEPCI